MGFPAPDGTCNQYKMLFLARDVGYKALQDHPGRLRRFALDLAALFNPKVPKTSTVDRDPFGSLIKDRVIQPRLNLLLNFSVLLTRCLWNLCSFSASLTERNESGGGHPPCGFDSHLRSQILIFWRL